MVFCHLGLCNWEYCNVCPSNGYNTTASQDIEIYFSNPKPDGILEEHLFSVITFCFPFPSLHTSLSVTFSGEFTMARSVEVQL